MKLHIEHVLAEAMFWLTEIVNPYDLSSYNNMRGVYNNTSSLTSISISPPHTQHTQNNILVCVSTV